MLRDNNTPFAALGFEQWHRDGATMAVCAVRVDLELAEDGSARLADAQEVVLADVFEGDPHSTPLLMPGDLVPFKPATDITFLGSAFAPGGAPAREIEASIRLPGIEKTICATGPREWTPRGDGWTLSDAEAVAEVALCYTKASGGRMIGDPDGDVDPRNPIGAHLLHPDFTPSGRAYKAAQIESRAEPIRDWRGPHTAPQGFGPMAPWWRSRQRFAGTYDDEWQRKVHPRLPTDFDYRFYNCAHPDLASPDFLTGGEIVELRNLTPSGDLAFQVPTETPFARFSFTDGREVMAAMNLDGLHMDFRTQPHRVTLTWRGWIEICPAFFRIDLECADKDEVAAMNLPAVTEAGLRLTA